MFVLRQTNKFFAREKLCKDPEKNGNEIENKRKGKEKGKSTCKQSQRHS